MSSDPFASPLPWTLPQLMRQAEAAYGRGEWVRAERLARIMLQGGATHPGALSLLSIIAAQTGRTAEAATLLQRAIAADPCDAAAHNNYGNVLRSLERWDAALASYDRALQIKPDYADAHNNRGNTLQELHRLDEALASHDRAVLLQPDSAAAHYNRGNTLQRLRRFDAALTSYDRALELEPGSAAVHYERANALQELRRCDEAVASYDRALQITPDCADAHNNRGLALQELRRFDEALSSYERAVQLQPDFAGAQYNRSNMLKQLRRFDEALAGYDRAIRIKPDYAEAYNNRGNALQMLGRADEALASYDRALEIDPQYVVAHSNRGNVLQDLRRFAEACNSYQRALQLQPDFEFLRGTWLHAKMQLCDWNDLTSQIIQVAEGIEQGHKVATPFVALTLIDSPALQRQAAHIWARGVIGAARSAIPLRRQRARCNKLRIGYLSQDFRAHPVGQLMTGVFEAHDRERFEIHALSTAASDGSEVRRRLEQGCARFEDVAALPDEALAMRIRELGIDIVIDLGGHTMGSRTAVLALRPAPVQLSWLGYPGTLGTSFIDYIIADRHVIPPDDRTHYAEQIVYLPTCYLPGEAALPVEQALDRVAAGLPANGPVYCCFNASHKIFPEVFALWMRVLRAVSNAVLWLGVPDATAQSNLLHQAERCEIDPARVVFAARAPSHDAHCRRLALADLFLDTRPYNAHATALDALRAGVPVLTNPGRTFAARVATSLLHACGLEHLSVSSMDRYEELAVELGQSPERITALKAQLRGAQSTAPLFDTARFCRDLERSFVEIWRRHERGERPCSFTVPRA